MFTQHLTLSLSRAVTNASYTPPFAKTLQNLSHFYTSYHDAKRKIETETQDNKANPIPGNYKFESNTYQYKTIRGKILHQKTLMVPVHPGDHMVCITTKLPGLEITRTMERIFKPNGHPRVPCRKHHQRPTVTRIHTPKLQIKWL